MLFQNISHGLVWKITILWYSTDLLIKMTSPFQSSFSAVNEYYVEQKTTYKSRSR